MYHVILLCTTWRPTETEATAVETRRKSFIQKHSTKNNMCKIIDRYNFSLPIFKEPQPYFKNKTKHVFSIDLKKYKTNLNKK